MAQAVLMPQVGRDIETGVLAEWTAELGDAVKPDDVIALVESDNAPPGLADVMTTVTGPGRNSNRLQADGEHTCSRR